MADARMAGSATGHLPLSTDDVLRAQRRLAGRVLRTPVVRCEELDRLAGARLWLKAENLQRGGSFKMRGALLAVQRLAEAGCRAQRVHNAIGIDRLHQAAAGGDERCGVRQREYPGQVGCGQLADGVADEVVGRDPAGRDELVQRRLQREQGGLGKLRRPQQVRLRSAGGSEHDVT
jgi:hypothetical protein